MHRIRRYIRLICGQPFEQRGTARPGARTAARARPPPHARLARLLEHRAGAARGGPCDLRPTAHARLAWACLPAMRGGRMGCTQARVGAHRPEECCPAVDAVAGGARLVIGARTLAHDDARTRTRALPSAPVRAGAGAERRQGGERAEAICARGRRAGGAHRWAQARERAAGSAIRTSDACGQFAFKCCMKATCISLI